MRLKVTLFGFILMAISNLPVITGLTSNGLVTALASTTNTLGLVFAVLGIMAPAPSGASRKRRLKAPPNLLIVGDEAKGREIVKNIVETDWNPSAPEDDFYAHTASLIFDLDGKCSPLIQGLDGKVWDSRCYFPHPEEFLHQHILQCFDFRATEEPEDNRTSKISFLPYTLETIAEQFAAYQKTTLIQRLRRKPRAIWPRRMNIVFADVDEFIREYARLAYGKNWSKGPDGHIRDTLERIMRTKPPFVRLVFTCRNTGLLPPDVVMGSRKLEIAENTDRTVLRQVDMHLPRGWSLKPRKSDLVPVSTP